MATLRRTNISPGPAEKIVSGAARLSQQQITDAGFERVDDMFGFREPGQLPAQGRASRSGREELDGCERRDRLVERDVLGIELRRSAAKIFPDHDRRDRITPQDERATLGAGHRDERETAGRPPGEHVARAIEPIEVHVGVSRTLVAPGREEPSVAVVGRLHFPLIRRL